MAGSISMDGGQPRGILKNAETGGDDTYLFCNVPEHHDLVSNVVYREIVALLLFSKGVVALLLFSPYLLLDKFRTRRIKSILCEDNHAWANLKVGEIICRYTKAKKQPIYSLGLQD